MLTNGIAFSTFAVQCIRNEILREIRKANAYKRNSNITIVYLNDRVSNGEDEAEFMDFLCDDYDIEEDIIEKENIELLHKAILCLAPIEQVVVRYYYFDEMSQEEIADLLCVSQPSINRIIKRSIRKMYRFLI